MIVVKTISIHVWVFLRIRQNLFLYHQKEPHKLMKDWDPPFWAHFSLPKHMFALLYAWAYFKVDPQTSGFPDPNDESYLGDSWSIPVIHMKSQQSSVVSVHG